MFEHLAHFIITVAEDAGCRLQEIPSEISMPCFNTNSVTIQKLSLPVLAIDVIFTYWPGQVFYLAKKLCNF